MHPVGTTFEVLTVTTAEGVSLGVDPQVFGQETNPDLVLSQHDRLTNPYKGSRERRNFENGRTLPRMNARGASDGQTLQEVRST